MDDFQIFILDPDNVFDLSNYNPDYSSEYKTKLLDEQDEHCRDWEEVKHKYTISFNEVSGFKQKYFEENILSINEILLLNYIKNYKFEKNIPQVFPKYWYYEKHIDLISSLKKLFEYGYVRIANTVEKLDKLSKVNLQEILKSKNLKTVGRKDDLIKRILDENINVTEIESFISFDSIISTELGNRLINDSEYLFFKNKSYLDLENLEKIHKDNPCLSTNEIYIIGIEQKIKRIISEKKYKFIETECEILADLYMESNIKKAFEYLIICAYCSIYDDELDRLEKVNKGIDKLWEDMGEPYKHFEPMASHIGMLLRLKEEHNIPEEFIYDCILQVEKFFPLPLTDDKRKERVKELFESRKNFIF